MRNPVAKKAAYNRSIFTLIWMLITALILMVVIFYQWQYYRLQQQRQLETVSKQAVTKLDNLIEDMLESAYNLPLYGEAIKDCERNLLPQLQKIVFNNPTISGLIISDSNNNTICSSLGEKYNLPPIANNTPYLHGPMQMGENKKNYFLLQQRLGHYYLGIYLAQSILEELLKPVTPQIDFITLYNNKQKKDTLQIKNKPENTLSAKLTNLLNKTSSLDLAKAQLQNLDDFIIIATNHHLQFNNDLFYKDVLVCLSILLLSIFLFLKLRDFFSKRQSLKFALANALKHDHFQPAYQPVFDNIQKRYCGAEVLIRWQTLDDEIIMPDLFIEEAESSGLIVPITIQLMEKAFTDCYQFLKKHPHFYLAFNFSACHFEDELFLDKFYQLCARYKITPQQLVLELTERELLNDQDPLMAIKMKELRDKGYALAIDDFGTGYASINYLQNFPFNYLKIDKVFINAIGTGAITETLNQAIIHLAHSLQLHVIAEGVETIQQFEFLQKNNIQFMQGWYFAKAMSYKDLANFIDEGSG